MVAAHHAASGEEERALIVSAIRDIFHNYNPRKLGDVDGLIEEWCDRSLRLSRQFSIISRASAGNVEAHLRSCWRSSFILESERADLPLKIDREGEERLLLAKVRAKYLSADACGQQPSSGAAAAAAAANQRKRWWNRS